MVRTQVQFTEAQIQALRLLSARTGRSIADLTRDAVDRFLAHPVVKNDVIRKRALSIVGAFASGLSDVSSNHDKYLADAFL